MENDSRTETFESVRMEAPFMSRGVTDHEDHRPDAALSDTNESGPNDFFRLVYLFWGLVPISLALYSLGDTSFTYIGIQCLAVMWVVGGVVLLAKLRLGALVSAFAVIAAWLPSTYRMAERILIIQGHRSDLNDAISGPGIFLIDTVIELGVWWIPTTWMFAYLVANAKVLWRH